MKDPEKAPEHISHLYQDGCNGHWVFQSNEEHSQGVANLAEQFADKFGMACYGRILGLLHDKGKEQKAFQQYIMKVSGYKGDAKVAGEHHHAFVGGIIAQRMYGKAADNLFVNQIISHHTGLHDSCDMASALSKEIPQEVNTEVEKQAIALPRFSSKPQKGDCHHISRMLFSCLVDADFLDTEAFMNASASGMRGSRTTLAELSKTLDEYLKRLKETTAATEVNNIRNRVQEQCLKMADGSRGFYSLTVPTGGGKTLSSLAWAVKHALKNGLDRIIIAIPYTSIIVQTATVLKAIFGEENVLEHHSDVDSEGIKNAALRERMKLATENWDYPIIVTTNVQLFESMYGNKPSVCRKLHNITNSVIILDEVQTLPTDFLKPIVDALKTYQKFFRVSVLFTTASQPVLSGLIEGCNKQADFRGIENIKEIIPSDFRLHEKLRRVELDFDDKEGKTYDEVAEMLAEHDRVLCIVNTHRDAREIFNRLPKEGVTLHLSRAMCPTHVSDTIEAVRNAIADKGNKIVRVVATQLVEAGVDIDFPVVYRQEAGLDSVLQAAGRCNREGKLDICTTHIFSLTKEHALPTGEMQAANNARKSMQECDWFAPSAMKEYFEQLYCRADTFDKKDMAYYLYEPESCISFETAAESFRLIEEKDIPVIVCWKNSMELVARLEEQGPSYDLMKKLSKYCVNVHKQDFDALCRFGLVSEVPKCDNLFVVKYKEQYDEKIGLRTDNNWADKVLTV